MEDRPACGLVIETPCPGDFGRRVAELLDDVRRRQAALRLPSALRILGFLLDIGCALVELRREDRLFILHLLQIMLVFPVEGAAPSAANATKPASAEIQTRLVERRSSPSMRITVSLRSPASAGARISAAPARR